MDPVQAPKVAPVGVQLVVQSKLHNFLETREDVGVSTHRDAKAVGSFSKTFSAPPYFYGKIPQLQTIADESVRLSGLVTGSEYSRKEWYLKEFDYGLVREPLLVDQPTTNWLSAAESNTWPLNILTHFDPKEISKQATGVPLSPSADAKPTLPDEVSLHGLSLSSHVGSDVAWDSAPVRLVPCSVQINQRADGTTEISLTKLTSAAAATSAAAVAAGRGGSLASRVSAMFGEFDLDSDKHVPADVMDSGTHFKETGGEFFAVPGWVKKEGLRGLARRIGLTSSLFSKDRIGAVSCSAAETNSGKTEGLKLQQVQVFFRHGARTPVYEMPGVEEEDWPSDVLCSVPHAERHKAKLAHVELGKPPRKTDFIKDPMDLLKGGVQLGQLTGVGKDQAYRLGKLLKEAYIDEIPFLKDEFEPGTIYARSSLVNRTITTLECLVAGLYDPDTVRNLKIHFSTHLTEILYPNTFVCPLLNIMSKDASTNRRKYIQAYSSVEGKILEKLRRFEDLSEDLKEIPVEEVYDNVTCRKTHGLDIPAGLDKMYHDITAVAAKHNTNVFMGYKTKTSSTPESVELRQTGVQVAAGPIFKMIYDTLIHGALGKRPEKMFLYAIHDSTIISILAGLDEEALERNWPPFCADIRIELYKDESNQHYVRTLYLGKPLTLGSGADADGCVPLSRFAELIEPYATDEKLYKEKCHLGMAAFTEMAKKAAKL